MRSLLDGVIVVGFALHNDTKVLGLSLPSAQLRDIQTCYTGGRCKELGLVGLPDLKPGQYHSLKNLNVSATL